MAETLSKQQRGSPKAARQGLPAKPAPGGAAAWRTELQAAGVSRQAQWASPLARAWLAAHTPHLLSVLGTPQIADLNQVLVARQPPHAARPETSRRGAAEAFHSERVDERLRREQRTRVAPVSSVAVVETADLLAADTEPSSPTPDPAHAREDGFRSRLRQRLAAEPSRLVFEGEAGSPLKLRIEWGRERRVLAHDGGCIHWRHLLQQTDWSQEHPRPPQDDGHRDADRQQRVDDFEAVMRLGGSEVKLLGQPVGRIRGYKVLRIGHELGRFKGYVDDTAGRAEMTRVLLAAYTATVVVKADNGWLHLFALDPPIRRADLGGSTDATGRVLITTRGGEVQGVQQIRLADATDMQQHGRDWSAPEDTERLVDWQSMFFGGVIGDFWEDPDATGAITQILVGLIPGIGLLADGRDLVAGLLKVWTSGTREGKVQTALALAGVLPFGDIAKLVKRRADKKTIAKALRDATAETQQRLAQVLLEEPGGVARRFRAVLPAGQAATQELSGGLRAFEAASAVAGRATDARAAEGAAGKAAEAYADAVARWLDESADNAMAVVVLSGDVVAKKGEKLVGWKRVAAALDAAGDKGKALGERMERWRAQQLESVIHDVQMLGKTRGAGEVVIKRTGTAKFSSDMDVNFLGADAAMMRNTAQELMEKRFGAQWGSMFDGAFLLDPRRLHLFDQLPSAQRARIEAVMVKESQVNVLARMRNDVYKASVSGDSAVQAAARRDADKLSRPIEELARKWGVPMEEVEQRATEARRLTREPGRVSRLELELDALHGRFNAATKPGERAALAEQIAVRQSRVNTANPEAYLTPGGVDLFVTGRDDLAGLGRLPDRTAGGNLEAMPGMSPLSASMKYMAVIDNLAMLHHTELAGSLHEQLKGMAKYCERLLLSTDHAATRPTLQAANPAAAAMQARIVERLKPLIDANDLFNRLVDGMAAARNDAANLMRQTSLPYDVERPFTLLQQHLEDLIARSRSGEQADAQVLATLDALDAQKTIVRRLAQRIVRRVYVSQDEPSEVP